MADAADSKSVARKGVWVQLPPPVLNMLTDYLSAALHRARYEILPDDQTFYGEIPDCTGVYANAATLEDCRTELAEVLEE